MRIMYFLVQQIRANSSKVILNIAEKNDAAKAISNLLSRGQSIYRDGRSKFNKIYEFNYELNSTLTSMIMTSVHGHLLDYKLSDEFNNWRETDSIHIFDAKLTKFCPDSSTCVKESLEDVARKCDSLIIWTDCDREGENIGMQIVTICLNVNPNLVVKRAQFSEITSSSINHAMMNLVDINVKLSQAVDVRKQFDLKTGAAFSRLQTLYLTSQFPQVLSNKIISYGSCQFPTLGFVVERYKEIKKFIPEPFWKICLTHVKDSQKAVFNWDRDRSFDEKLVSSIYSNISKGGTLGCVIDVKDSPKVKLRPVPMNTIEMEILASKKLGLSPRNTMQIAEKLYRKGYISYPRTETNMFSTDIGLTNLVTIQISDHRWGGFAKQLLSQGIEPHNGKKFDNAHPPIHPLVIDRALEGDDAKVFELITRHFLACLSKNATGREAKIFIDCVSKSSGFNNWLETSSGSRQPSGIGEVFSLFGLSVIQKNYLDVYPYEKWLDKELSIYKVGDILENVSLAKHKGHTSPPSFLTDADLITLMDKHGIGTDATHADHIDKVKVRQYVQESGNKKNYLIPGALGMGLVEGYNLVGINLSHPDYRSRFEADLKLICEGQKHPQDVLNFHLNEYKTIYRETASKIDKLKEGVLKYLLKREIISNNSSSSKKDISSNVLPHTICNHHCHCGIPAAIHTVIDGNDKGKSFYVCSLSNCSMISLVDEKKPLIGSAPVSPSKVISPESFLTVNNKQPAIVCHCNKKAVIQKCMKRGENKGRLFFGCSQVRNCGFVQWYEKPEESGIVPFINYEVYTCQPVVPPLDMKRTEYETRKEATKNTHLRYCSVCNLPGHSANKCPQRLK